MYPGLNRVVLSIIKGNTETALEDSDQIHEETNNILCRRIKSISCGALKIEPGVVPIKNGRRR